MGNEAQEADEGLPDDVRKLIAELDGSAAAPFLFSEDTIDEVGAKAGAHFTARYLKERQPRLYRACVALCGADYSLREVSELLSISKNTVAAVIDDAPELLGTLKRKTARRLRRAGLKLAERIDEEADRIPIGQLAVTLGIVTDKAQLLEGEATSIVETKHSARHADWSETLQCLEAEYRLIEGGNGEKGDPGNRVLELREGVDFGRRGEPADSEAHDTESPAEADVYRMQGVAAARSATEAGPETPSDTPPGGEGVAPENPAQTP